MNTLFTAPERLRGSHTGTAEGGAAQLGARLWRPAEAMARRIKVVGVSPSMDAAPTEDNSYSSVGVKSIFTPSTAISAEKSLSVI